MKKLRITVDGKVYDVDVEVLQDDDNHILPSYYQQTVPHHSNAPVVRHSGDSALHHSFAPKQVKKPVAKVNSDNNTLTSPINGIVLEIPVKAGQKVAENETVLVLEAMKMKTNISSPFSGEISIINVKQGDTIEAGDVLITFKKEE